MITCNIEVNYYTGVEENDFSHSVLEYVVNFPVLPEIGSILSITKSIERTYEVLDIEYRTVIRDCHTITEPSTMEIYIIVKEL